MGARPNFMKVAPVEAALARRNGVRQTIVHTGQHYDAEMSEVFFRQLGIRVGHVEAGLRSRDWSMPEEINRVVTDRLADLLFTPSRDGNDNLAAEGVPAERIHLVGNVMIDTLVRLLELSRR